MPRLPENAKASGRKVYEGFGELLSLKFLVERAPSPYTWGFIESWVGVSKKVSGRTMRWLLGAGFIRFVGNFGSDEANNRVQLFTMGTRRLVERLSGRPMLESGGQTEIIESVQTAVDEVERELRAEDDAKRELRWCGRCGELVEWVGFEVVVTCLNCWQTIDSG